MRINLGAKMTGVSHKIVIFHGKYFKSFGSVEGELRQIFKQLKFYVKNQT